ncbi:MAG TPA: response regulator transcription factor [Pseudobacteroides sp.]|nr:response regulator transcription factor [Pseudobacteroides sp.]
MKIALIDDHALVLQGLQAKLETIADFEIVGAYTEVNDLLLCLKYKDVDIVVMDLMLKGIHGFELIEKIKHLRDKEIKIILISGFYEEILHKRALDMGVKAFLRKEVSYEELISCIINVGKGNNVIPDFLMEQYANPMLTEAELNVLRYVVEEYTNERIAQELYISRRTVESHISNICRKLEVNSRIGIVREAIKLKLL